MRCSYIDTSAQIWVSTSACFFSQGWNSQTCLPFGKMAMTSRSCAVRRKFLPRRGTLKTISSVADHARQQPCLLLMYLEQTSYGNPVAVGFLLNRLVFQPDTAIPTPRLVRPEMTPQNCGVIFRINEVSSELIAHIARGMPCVVSINCS